MTDSTGPNGTRSAAALLVDCLGVQGCERIFTVPGESFLAVLDAEREVLNTRDQLVQAQVGTATALVTVYRALGGGWTPPPATATTVGKAP